MKIKLLSRENWSEVISDIEQATEKLGVKIEPSFYFLGHMPREEYLKGKFGICRQFLTVLLPREFVILHADFPVQGAAGWFTLVSGIPIIQIYQRGLQSIEPNFKYWESEILVHELCHYFYWRNGLEDKTHYFHYDRKNLMSAVEDIIYQLYIKKVGLLEQVVRLLRRLKPLQQEDIERTIVLHHSATSRDFTRVETLVRNIAKTHPGGFYNYYIDKDGGVHPQVIIDKKRNTIDVCVIGDFTKESPSEGQIKAIKRIITGKQWTTHKELAEKGLARPSLCPGNLKEFLS